MGNFQEWLKDRLLNEDGFDDGGSDWFFGSYLYPSDAHDWQYAHPYPSDYFLLQSRWKKDKALGRKFINMDIDPIVNQNFVALQSNTMPNEASWKHKPDNQPNVTINNDAKPLIMGVGKNSSDINKLVASNDLLDKTKELNKMFGDFMPNYASEASDVPWFREFLALK